MDLEQVTVFTPGGAHAFEDARVIVEDEGFLKVTHTVGDKQFVRVYGPAGWYYFERPASDNVNVW